MKAHKLGLRKKVFYFKGKLWKVRKMAEPEKSWLACAIDGEGSIIPAKSKYQKGVSIRVQVNNCHREFVEKCKQITGVGYICVGKRENRKPIYRWCCQANPLTLQILEQIKDYLIIKRELAELGIKYIKSRLAHYSCSKSGYRVPLTEEELELVTKMRNIKPKGKKL